MFTACEYGYRNQNREKYLIYLVFTLKNIMLKEVGSQMGEKCSFVLMNQEFGSVMRHSETKRVRMEDWESCVLSGRMLSVYTKGLSSAGYFLNILAIC